MQPQIENQEYEQNVLGQLLLENSALEEIDTVEDDFTNGLNRRIFAAIKERCAAHEPANICTIATMIPGEAGYIANLTSLIPSAANISFYSKEIRKLAAGRQLRRMGLTVVERAGVDEPDVIRADVEKELTELAGQEAKKRSRRVGETLRTTLSQIEAAYHAKGRITGVSTGYESLDGMTDGFHCSEFIVIGARPSVGKTALALSFASRAAKSGVPTAFFSLEMSMELLNQRLLSAETRIDGMKLRKGYLNSSVDFSRLMDGAGRLYALPLFVFDKPSMKLGEVVAEARRLKRSEKIGILFIDYIGLIRFERNDIPRHEQFSEISRSLKALARELEIPVVALSQLGRQAEGQRPTLADLRESGSIEQDADVVMFINRKREEAEGSGANTELIIAKQRNGPVGTVPLRFLPGFTTFAEVERAS